MLVFMLVLLVRPAFIGHLFFILHLKSISMLRSVDYTVMHFCLFFKSRRMVAVDIETSTEEGVVALVAESPCTTREGSLMASWKLLAGMVT